MLSLYLSKVKTETGTKREQEKRSSMEYGVKSSLVYRTSTKSHLLSDIKAVFWVFSSSSHLL